MHLRNSVRSAMRVPATQCPDCQATLRSKAGILVGSTIECPKCSLYFEVNPIAPTAANVAPTPVKKVRVPEDDEPPRRKPKRAIVDEDEDEEEEEIRPRKKKGNKASNKSKSGGYATSPIRFVVLGVLLVILGVAGYFLYVKLTKPPEVIVIQSTEAD